MGLHTYTLIPVLMVNIHTCHNGKVLREMDYTKKYEKEGKFTVKGMDSLMGSFLFACRILLTLP